LDGLLPLLEALVDDSKASKKISTIVPARIYRCKGHSELFKLRLRPAMNGFKGMVRKGHTAQDVFFSTTTMDEEELKASLQLQLAAGFDLEVGGSCR
ncbi:unnamed protein product, partial [Choristocarpus tenellus]